MILFRCVNSWGSASGGKSPDHSSLSVIRARLLLEVHEAVFVRLLKVIRDKGLLDGKTVGVDSTTL